MTNATGRTDYSGWQILGNTALSVGIGIVAGSITSAGKAGITAGRNSFRAVWKSGLTKLSHGTVSRMSKKVMLKGLASIAFMRYKSAMIGGGISSIIDWFNYFFKNIGSGVGYL